MCVKNVSNFKKHETRVDSKYHKGLQYLGVFDYNEFKNKTTQWEILWNFLGAKFQAIFLYTIGLSVHQLL